MRGLLAESVAVLRALAVVVLTGTMATAATYTWDGGDGSSQDWSQSSNWDVAGVPLSASTSDIVFSSNISNRGTAAVPLNQNIGTPLVVNSLTFSNTPNVGGAYYLGGSQLQFEADGATQPSIVSTNLQSRYFANDIELAASATLDLRNVSHSFYFNGAISGDGALLMTGQAGGGQVFLNNGTNSYSGGTTYKGTHAGQGYVALRVPVTGALGTGLVTLDGGNRNPYDAVTNTRPGGLIFTGTGTTYANDFSLDSDSPVFVAMTSMGGSAASSADLSGDFDLNGNALYLRGIGTGTIAGDISSTGGGGSLVKIDSGTWVLSGTNTYAGTTTISDGVLSISAAANLGPGDIILDGGTLQTTGDPFSINNNITLTDDSALEILTTGSRLTYLRGVISDGAGTFGFTKTGSGYLYLTGDNTYDGETVLSGVVYIAHNNALGSTAGGTTMNGTLTVTSAGMVINEDLNISGTLRTYPGVGSSTTYAGDITLIGNTAISAKYAGSTFNITGDVGGDYGLTINNEPGTTRLSGTNTYTGTTTVRRSTLLIGADAPNGAAGALGNATSAVNLGRSGTNYDVALLTDGAFTVGRDLLVTNYNPAGTTTIGGNQTSGASQFSGNITLNRDVILTSANTDGNAVTFSGDISGTGHGVTKTGLGTVVLSGSNTYSGATNVEDGILKLGSAGALGNSSGVTVVSGATVDVNGFDANKSFTIAGTGSSGQGALVNSGGDIIGHVGVTLAADATIGITGGRMDIGIGRPLVGNGFTLTKVGAGRLPIRNAAGSFGAINVDEGLLYFETNQTGMGSTPITVASGATVAMYYTRTINAPVTLNGGTLLHRGGGPTTTSTWSGPVTVNSTSTLSTSGGNLALTGPIAGAGGLDINGPNMVTLSGTNSYNGATNVNSGILRIGSADALGNTSGVTVASGATFDFNGFKPNKNFTIAGTGTSGQGALYSDGYLIGNVGITLSADATIGVTANRLDIGIGRPLDGGGFTLTKIGAGSLPIRGAANNFAGINVDEGLVYFEANQAGMSSTTLSVASGATLAIYTSSTDRSVNAPVVLNGGSLAQLGNHSGTSGTWSGDFTVNSNSNIVASGNNMVINGTIGGSGDLNISGPRTITLTGANSYSGATAVNSGTLVVDGSIASSSALSLSAAATLAGHGTVPTISGAGLVSPGNSPGILTAASVDPTAGLDFALEFTAGSPDYTDATASLNDVLRLTAAADPFEAVLDGSNTVGVYFDVSQIEKDDVFLGGFYTDRSADFTDFIAGASFAYYLTGDGGGTHDLGGQSYYTLAEYNASMGFDVTTIADVANFGAGDVNGYVMQLTASVPEPTACLLLILGLTGLLLFRRR